MSPLNHISPFNLPEESYDYGSNPLGTNASASGDSAPTAASGASKPATTIRLPWDPESPFYSKDIVVKDGTPTTEATVFMQDGQSGLKALEKSRPPQSKESQVFGLFNPDNLPPHFDPNSFKDPKTEAQAILAKHASELHTKGISWKDALPLYAKYSNNPEQACKKLDDQIVAALKQSEHNPYGPTPAEIVRSAAQKEAVTQLTKKLESSGKLTPEEKTALASAMEDPDFYNQHYNDAPKKLREGLSGENSPSNSRTALKRKIEEGVTGKLGDQLSDPGKIFGEGLGKIGERFDKVKENLNKDFKLDRARPGERQAHKHTPKMGDMSKDSFEKTEANSHQLTEKLVQGATLPSENTGKVTTDANFGKVNFTPKPASSETTIASLLQDNFSFEPKTDQESDSDYDRRAGWGRA